MKVEPPGGDQLLLMSPAWYETLCVGQQVVRLDLKDGRDLASLELLLARADVRLTSQRSAALARLSLSWAELHPRFPNLVQVAIVGFREPNQHLPRHDLTYLAARGLLPPECPERLWRTSAARRVR